MHFYYYQDFNSYLPGAFKVSIKNLIFKLQNVKMIWSIKMYENDINWECLRENENNKKIMLWDTMYQFLT